MVIDGVIWDERKEEYVKNSIEVRGGDQYGKLQRGYDESECRLSGSYVKLGEVKVGYEFGSKWVRKRGIKNLGV